MLTPDKERREMWFNSPRSVSRAPIDPVGARGTHLMHVTKRHVWEHKADARGFEYLYQRPESPSFSHARVAAMRSPRCATPINVLPPKRSDTRPVVRTNPNRGMSTYS